MTTWPAVVATVKQCCGAPPAETHFSCSSSTFLSHRNAYKSCFSGWLQGPIHRVLHRNGGWSTSPASTAADWRRRIHITPTKQKSNGKQGILHMHSASQLESARLWTDVFLDALHGWKACQAPLLLQQYCPAPWLPCHLHQGASGFQQDTLWLLILTTSSMQLCYATLQVKIPMQAHQPANTPKSFQKNKDYTWIPRYLLVDCSTRFLAQQIAWLVECRLIARLASLHNCLASG